MFIRKHLIPCNLYWIFALSCLFLLVILFALQGQHVTVPILRTGRSWIRPYFSHSHLASIPHKGYKFSLPWSSVPYFQMYMRMAASERFLYEYKDFFVPSFRAHFPPERWFNSLILGLDDEKEDNHRIGEELKNKWPYPKIFYHKPTTDKSVYLNSQRNRGFLDQFYPENYIRAIYVGYIDTDTFFSATVTPESLFENGKPVVIGRVGNPAYDHWSKVTHYLLGFKEAMQCMSYFPFIIKVKHVVEARNFIARRFQKPFESVFRSGEVKWPTGTCQFSIMCNYIWYFHRDDYSFHLHRVIKGMPRFSPGMTTLSYLLDETKDKPDVWLPKPRIAIHARYIVKPSSQLCLPGNMYDASVIAEINHIFKASYCFTLGLEECPKFCEDFKNETVFHYLYRFEYWDWEWHDQCFPRQQIYLKEARNLLMHYRALAIPVYGEGNGRTECPPYHLRKKLPYQI